ncbi:Uncharacterised protein [Escherichia coli]|uniref:Uncharacterized protein n=1 Tax=Escherichia coli TaxID=562 RepID=A0A376L310_ECOLX|nr:Uncharacterised protein [Escherichia coli]
MTDNGFFIMSCNKNSERWPWCLLYTFKACFLPTKKPQGLAENIIPAMPEEMAAA